MDTQRRVAATVAKLKNLCPDQASGEELLFCFWAFWNFGLSIFSFLISSQENPKFSVKPAPTVWVANSKLKKSTLCGPNQTQPGCTEAADPEQLCFTGEGLAGPGEKTAGHTRGFTALPPSSCSLTAPSQPCRAREAGAETARAD